MTRETDTAAANEFLWKETTYGVPTRRANSAQTRAVTTHKSNQNVIRQTNRHQQIAQDRTEQELDENIATIGAQASNLSRMANKLAQQLHLEYDHQEWIGRCMDHASLKGSQVPKDDYEYEAQALGLKQSPPLYVVANPLYFAQRMELRLTKPRIECQDDPVAHKLHDQFNAAKRALSALYSHLDTSTGRFEVMQALFQEIEQYREDKEKTLALEKKVAALNPSRHPAGATRSGGRSQKFFPNEHTNVFYTTPSGTPFDTFFVAAEGNDKDPRARPTKVTNERQRRVSRVCEWVESCATASDRALEHSKKKVMASFNFLYGVEAPIQKLWKEKVYEYEAQLRKLDAEYDKTCTVMNKIADNRDALEAAWTAKQDPLRLAKRRMEFRTQRPNAEKLKDIADSALRSEVLQLTTTMGMLEAKIVETDARLNTLEVARRNLVDKIKVKKMAVDVEKESKAFSIEVITDAQRALINEKYDGLADLEATQELGDEGRFGDTEAL